MTVIAYVYLHEVCLVSGNANEDRHLKATSECPPRLLVIVLYLCSHDAAPHIILRAPRLCVTSS